MSESEGFDYVGFSQALVSGLETLTNTSGELLKKEMESALKNMNDRAVMTNDRITQHEIRQLNRRMSDPVLQEKLKTSFDSMRMELQRSIDSSPEANRVSTINGLRNALNGIGRGNQIIGLGITAEKIISGIESGDAQKVGEALAVTLVTLVAAAVIGTFVSGVLAPIIAVGLAAYLISEFLPVIPGFEDFAETVGEFVLDLWGRLKGFFDDTISLDVNQYFNVSLTTASPIVLDLDGDGLELYGAGGGTLFLSWRVSRRSRSCCRNWNSRRF